MGFGLFGSFLILTLFFRPLVSQVPNTDEFFVLDFLQKMGLKPSKENGFNGSFCSWRGVVCDSKGENVIKLEFPGLGLLGSIPDITIGKLINLEYLDLSNNKITSLPSDLYSLGSLKNLNLSHNQISGILPNNIGNFGQLQVLDLSFNKFYGSIPEAISSLNNLKALNFNENGFESRIPLGITQCRFLTSIDLSGNKFNSSLPNGFGSAFPQLEFLNLAGNRILGRDSDFFAMKSIRYLNISDNMFKGSVVGIFKGPLEVLDLRRNQFEGHLPQVNFSLMIYLDMSENEFSGKFSTQFNGYVMNLKYLNLAYNRFTEQEMLLQVDMLSSLEYLNLSRTNLVGRIPSNISRLHSLRTLDLSRNHLSSRIPRIVSKNLQVLDLSYNKLIGDIPLNLLQELNEMKRFNFSYNNLSYCGSQFSSEYLRTAFIGTTNSCPIAANPVFFKSSAPKHKGLKLAIVLALSMISLLVGLLVLAFGCRRKTRMWAVKQNSCKEEQVISGPFSFQTDSTTWVADVKQAASVPVVIFQKPLLDFTFADLLSATSHFNRDTLLAEGRFGPVYGGLLPGGSIHVAVKVLVHGSTMTDQEAARELEYLGRIKHPNLVPLIGYCLAGDQRIAIYEYMENGNLHNLLYDLPLDDTSWSFRHKIALGTARALAFLHHGCSPPIIHRDIKASSVYLDSNLEPRLSDFGLARIFGNELEDEIGRGSPGYVPPEFLDQPESSPTPKSDVYGFGVILFELITGKRPVEDDYPGEKDDNLVSWVRGLVRMNQGSRGIDPKIRGLALDGKMIEALKIGYLCTAENPYKRPTMHQVVGLLKDLELMT